MDCPECGKEMGRSYFDETLWYCTNGDCRIVSIIIKEVSLIG